MNKITHEGKDYEVLPLGKHRDMTHVLFAGGTVEEAEACNDPGRGFWVYSDNVENPNGDSYTVEKAKLHNIQPLKLLPKTPVEFVAEMGSAGNGFWFPIYCLDDAIAYQNSPKKKFRCIEVTE